MCKESQEDKLTALESRHKEEHVLFLLCCLGFMAVYLYWLTVEAAQGHHGFLQWQQTGVIITSESKTRPYFTHRVVRLEKVTIGDLKINI